MNPATVVEGLGCRLVSTFLMLKPSAKEASNGQRPTPKPKSHDTPGPSKGPSIESWWPLLAGIWGILEGSWGSRPLGNLVEPSVTMESHGAISQHARKHNCRRGQHQTISEPFRTEMTWGLGCSVSGLGFGVQGLAS